MFAQPWIQYKDLLWKKIAGNGTGSPINTSHPGLLNRAAKSHMVCQNNTRGSVSKASSICLRVSQCDQSVKRTHLMPVEHTWTAFLVCLWFDLICFYHRHFKINTIKYRQWGLYTGICKANGSAESNLQASVAWLCPLLLTFTPSYEFHMSVIKERTCYHNEVETTGKWDISGIHPECWCCL